MIKKKILIAAGGTGGHIIPAYSLANYLIKDIYMLHMLIYLHNNKNQKWKHNNEKVDI